MIRLPDLPLPEPARTQLAAYQHEIDAIPDYATRIKHGRKRFKALNRKGNPTFDSVKATLTRMCIGARRCAYCEDSAAHQVEHIRPKAFYPELIFAWMNYLYACGACNEYKNSRFAVFAQETSTLTKLRRAKGAPVGPPVSGSPVLIDPRIEDPSEFLELDLSDTFHFLPSAPEGTVAHQRATYTIKALGLNTRDYLPVARADAYTNYHSHLTCYVAAKQKNGPPERLAQLEQNIRTHHHPSVWREVKRQHPSLRDMKHLFEAAPEALRW
ncbi:hypothetical protein [Corallococcus aberystwythensis]|uniref:TIGR02646 family protein n=1 Tax=Corallococcus aberystwythensis TaxID=2316722 RepID=A0A3A8QL56_9BACT|nr:hypothetical protein [Corallococcus aberystwythensis]RKH67670.1 hypothetical protein D7W81_13515 [Corallococcus aberystwythensis]